MGLGYQCQKVQIQCINENHLNWLELFPGYLRNLTLWLGHLLCSQGPPKEAKRCNLVGLEELTSGHHYFKLVHI